jgi:segregation and condensation protein A
MRPEILPTMPPGAFEQDSPTEGEPPAAPAAPPFAVHLANFDGPFDLLLSLITHHKMDVTEVALAQVTDEFVAYIRGHERWDLDTASDFLVVAATLLDLKALRLLPAGPEEDPEDLALLEARDLLFARLLQYRAFKAVAAGFARRLEIEERYHARAVALEPHFAELLPELVWRLGPGELAQIAAAVFARPSGPAPVETGHLHASPVSVAEQAAVIKERLARRGVATFRDLVADAEGRPAVIVGRFLALLELYKQDAVSFEQLTPLGDLTIRWTAAGDGAGQFDEYDDGAGPSAAVAPEEDGTP